MRDTVIKAEGIGKKYIISHEAPEKYTTLRDTLHRKAKGLFRKGKHTTKEEFRALTDISFEVKRGEAIGIIGRNGAGKSTLLKILSRITEPTEGRVEINGRTSSLLEVGTGFHPELTGRENIFLNGAILGMGRTEIKKKFDAIVDFSGVEKFLDTPVKRYSSGMYLRLAFAVAAHLEPEILIVDEVLAVGDAEFQKKCLGKMDEVTKKEGRTVLFVSHNLEAIVALCNTGFYLENGNLMFHGVIGDVIEKYVSYSKDTNAKFTAKDKSKPLFFNDLVLQENTISFNGTISMDCEIISDSFVNDFTIGISIANNMDHVVGTTVLYCRNKLINGINRFRIFVPANFLVPGIYHFILAIAKGQTFENDDVVAGFPVFTIHSNSETSILFAKWNSAWGSNLLNNVRIETG